MFCYFAIWFFLCFFENLERASVCLLISSAKQGNHWYHFVNVFGMTRPLAGIEPWTSRNEYVNASRNLCKSYENMFGIVLYYLYKLYVYFG